MQELEVEQVRLAELPTPVRGVGGVRARVVAGSPLVGRNLRELRFRDRFGLVIVGVRRGESLQATELGNWVLKADDEIFALGSRERLEALARHPDFEVLEMGLTAVRDLVTELHLLRIPQESSLVGSSIGASRLGELVGLTVAGLIREDETHLAVSPEEILRADDRLLIGGDPERLLTLVELGEVRLEAEAEETTLESEEIGMVEAALAPRSAAIGRTLADLEFQSRYGLLALALWREGKPHHVDFSHVPLRLGDALLLHGPRKEIRRLAAEPDFVVLSQADQAPRRLSKAKWAFAALLLMIVLVVSGAQPIHVAAFTAAALAILFGALTMQEAYRAIEWKAIFLVAAVLPVGMAMERTGAAMFLADGVTTLAGPLGNHATLAALVVLASLLSQGLDGAPTVVLLAPVVINAAHTLGISPYPLMMGVSLAASAAFMTPFSHKANLLVMGAGGYRSSDYLKVGTPLTLVVFVLLVLLVPIFFPF
jgi:di/tricarboxylate transporter